jgi:hypothetical protein
MPLYTKDYGRTSNSQCCCYAGVSTNKRLRSKHNIFLFGSLLYRYEVYMGKPFYATTADDVLDWRYDRGDR